MKKIIFVVSVILLFISCKPQFTEQSFFNAKDAVDYILQDQDMEDKRIIFIGENHVTVNSVLFLSENLQKYYDNGVRYMFFEARVPMSFSDDDVQFVCFFPWVTAGWKYEWRLLGQAIQDINNSVPEEDKLHILYPEEGNEGTITNENILHSIEERMNQRDMFAFNNISDVIDNIKPNEKALIFYGDEHGAKKPIRSTYIDPSALLGRKSYMWNTFSSLLTEKYGEEFASFGYTSLNDYINNETQDSNIKFSGLDVHKILFEDDSETYSIPHNLKKYLEFYDAVITDREAVYGIYYEYIPSYENLKFIFSSLKKFEENINEVKQEENYYHVQDQGQYLMYIYYLKLYFGDAFDYQFWNTIKPLAIVLSELENTLFKDDDTMKEKLLVSKDMNTLREYHKFMWGSGISDFIERSKTLQMSWVIENMEKATELFPEDLWAWYWLAYAKTEDKKYEEAAKLWEYITSQPLAYCMETLPNMYEQLAYCYEKLGETHKSNEAFAFASSLTNEHTLNVSEYVDMR